MLVGWRRCWQLLSAWLGSFRLLHVTLKRTSATSLAIPIRLTCHIQARWQRGLQCSHVSFVSLTVCHEEAPCLISKSSINVQRSLALWNYWRVTDDTLHESVLSADHRLARQWCPLVSTLTMTNLTGVEGETTPFSHRAGRELPWWLCWWQISWFGGWPCTPKAST